ncbi:hypothetical protein BX616_004140 [Lobosporangium transversale]|uniref:Uncharacterized protein n=1 Tax=Lobosporangium transversale TaxID=64571 RepID=A0A1Y2G6X9_9FUNG|nr:hypothetical protein BCR41DRAFT_363890 [Lobosporangium transversale]KAF9898355.1 hypothetical protein BX616_004140 [Lobosporangium transversale]ORY99585.1 hypothetical protein BCR41DRAFT_363890 [Lobosporangium transversale]|eukprot:XP_021875880.1 hypothetical protein BCR41DRAFT_363890 [Lobosporangium transversale]
MTRPASSGALPRPSSIHFASTSEDGNRNPVPAHAEDENESSSSGASSPRILRSIPLFKSWTTDTMRGSSSRPDNRRSSWSNLTERLRTSSHSRSRNQSIDDEQVTKDKRKSYGGDDFVFKYSGRRSSDFMGAYADVAKAQALYMERLREEQLRKNIKKNIDGLPIPPPVERRRSSVTHLLGMDKPLLSR